MSAINDDVYARVRDKVKEHELTEQEIKAIDRARDQLQSHTYTGGIVGATTAFLIAKRKKFNNPIQLLAVTGGGFLMGTQIGVISGALAGVKTINSLPNPQRIINVVREVQAEIMKGKQAGIEGSSSRGAQPTFKPHQMTPQEIHESQSKMDEFSPENAEYQQGGGNSAWNNRRGPSSLSSSREVDMTDESDPLSRKEAATTRSINQQQQQQRSAWDKVRSESLPNNTWSKIRMEAQQNPDDVVEIAKSKAARAQRLREGADFSYDNVEELPRTREETMQKSASRKNQWGDPLN
ncbi:hypothetical protein EDC94DRAFT_556185 [Helicostylum pulchrum]|nr:hypothetical protein EDC94DRAFT_556185 [Helicostylum pulchrum]